MTQIGITRNNLKQYFFIVSNRALAAVIYVLFVVIYSANPPDTRCRHRFLLLIGNTPLGAGGKLNEGKHLQDWLSWQVF